MQKTINPFIFSSLILLTLSSCVSVDMTPPDNVGMPTESVSQPQWQDYRVDRSVGRSKEPITGWQGKSAWSNGPANRSFEPITETAVERVDLGSVDTEVSKTEQSNVAYQLKSAWADSNVPSLLLPKFRKSAIEAKAKGKSTFVDDGTNYVYEFAKLWDSGECASVEVLILTEGGKLPIISRGTVEVCGY